MSVSEFSCAHCGTYACKKETESGFPKFCLTRQDLKGVPIQEELKEIQDRLQGDNPDARIFRAAAETEGFFFCQDTRVEETMEFARRIGAKKIGIATCHGLMNETKILARILEANGFDYIVVGCKVGNLDKTEMGIEEETKIHPGGFEASCNPILQAKILNAHKTDLNIIMGLCVGHDSLFIRYSDAYVTVLVTKDRVLGHAPVMALYTAEEYRPWLLDPAKKKK